jgi:hypothetical protein
MSDGEKLFRAAGAGDDAKVKRLLKAKADVNFGCSRKGWSGDGKSFTVTGVTALQAACGRGHLGVARLLLKAKASVGERAGELKKPAKRVALIDMGLIHLFMM